MIVWGGYLTNGYRYLNDGGRYTPASDSWTPVPTNDGPYLNVTFTNAGVIVSWPKPATGWNLEYAAQLTGGTNAWTQVPPPYQTNATDCYVIEPSPSGNKFYRLKF